MKKAVMLINDTTYAFNLRGEIIKKLVDKGFEVVIVGQLLKHQDKLKAIGAKLIGVETDRRGTNPFSDLHLMYTYKKILSGEKPDVVLTFNIKPNVYGGIACRLLKIPYIPNVTGLGTAVENGGLMQKITLTLYKIGLCNAQKVFFQNAENRDFMLQHGLVKGAYEVLPGSGVNLDLHCFEQYPQDDGELRFLFVGRIMRDKGIAEFLDCAGYIKGKYPNMQFDVIGELDEEKYHTWVEELHGKGVIHFYGRRSDVHEFMKTHHALILPSYHEGMSNVLLEAAATGRPVIATDVPGCRETYDDEISGIGFESKSSEALIHAVERFIELPYEKKQQMGIAGRKKVEAEFDRKKVIAAYLDAMKVL